MTDAPRNIDLRRFLMKQLSETITAWGVSQKEAATRLGVTQPRVNLLLNQREERFSVDNLIELAPRAGLSVHLVVGEATFTAKAANSTDALKAPAPE